jgi:hypothetical protein
MTDRINSKKKTRVSSVCSNMSHIRRPQPAADYQAKKKHVFPSYNGKTRGSKKAKVIDFPFGLKLKKTADTLRFLSSKFLKNWQRLVIQHKALFNEESLLRIGCRNFLERCC